MWYIKRKTKSGKIIGTVLAKGDTEESAWAAFNSAETYLNFRETVIFVAVNE